jgi:glycosyltransferase involved in cell wall biosynthesis
MPVLNGQRYLGLAIESILGQTFQDFEFLIVNDGSTDRSADIIQEYASRDPRVILLEHNRRGLAEALNAGCRTARGHYIARMDCDDIARPDRFARQVDFLDDRKDVAVLGGAAQLIDAAGRPLSELRYPPEGASLRDALATGCWVIHPSVMMRRSVFRDVGFYRQACAPGEDYDLWARVADDGLVVNLPGPVLIDFRAHEGQVSNTQMRRQLIIGMVVQRATSIRRETGSDPIAAIADVDQNAARELGITDAEIDRRYIDTVSQKAMNAVRLGATEGVEAARAMMDALKREALSGAGRAHLAQAAKEFEIVLQLEAIRKLGQDRRYCAAAIRGLTAGIRRPQILARALSSLRRSGQSAR